MVAAALAAVAQAPVSSAQGAPPHPDEETARLISETTGLTKGEAMRLMALDPHVQALRERLQEKYPDRLAAVWMDIRDHGRVKVAMAGPGPMPSDVKQGFPQPELVDETPVEHPAATLDGLKRRIEHDGSQLRQEGFEVVSVAIDVRANRVRVGAAEPDRVRAELEKRYPADQLLVVKEEPPRPAVCYSRSDCEPWRGGIEVMDIPPEARCSTAFSVWMLGSSYSSPLGYQYEGLLTAGHCFGLNDVIEHRGETIGPVDYDKFAGSVDGAAIVHDLGFVEPEHIAPRIYQSGTNMWWAINSDASLSDGGVGSPICHSGITRGYRCGTIELESYSFWYGVTRFTDLRQDNICNLPGDSGGAVFYNNKAHGIMNFGNFEGGSDNPTCASSPRTTYTQIYYVERDFNVSVQHAS